jgi:hypothetical protein
MANLSGQNIGTNYKGILNLNTLNGNLTTTLQAVTDGDGNASPLKLSSTNVEVNNNFKVQRVGDIYTFGEFNTGGGFFEQKYGDGGGGVGYFNRYSAGWWLSDSILISSIYGTPSARLHVRGDGTNPIFRLDNSDGIRIASVNNTGDTFNYGTVPNIMYVVNQNGSSSPSGKALAWASNIDIFAGFNFRYLGNVNHSYTSGNGGLLDIGSLGATFGAGAGSANFRPLNIAYTINNSGAQTGTATGIFLNATETALNEMGHNLMDLQTTISGVTASRFSVGRARDIAFRFNQNPTNRHDLFTISRIGSTTIPVMFFGTGLAGAIGNDSAFIGSSNDYLTLGNVVGTTANNLVVISGTTNALIGLGGITNAFPALKRNGTAIDFRLADDSAFCNISCGALTTAGDLTLKRSDNAEVMSFFNTPFVLDFGAGLNRVRFQSQTVCINSAPDASAALTITSTTKGFLPPRMTSAQRDLIGTPGTPTAGLMIYNTSTNRPNFFDGTNWVAL